MDNIELANIMRRLKDPKWVNLSIPVEKSQRKNWNTKVKKQYRLFTSEDGKEYLEKRCLVRVDQWLYMLTIFRQNCQIVRKRASSGSRLYQRARHKTCWTIFTGRLGTEELPKWSSTQNKNWRYFGKVWPHSVHFWVLMNSSWSSFSNLFTFWWSFQGLKKDCKNHKCTFCEEENDDGPVVAMWSIIVSRLRERGVRRGFDSHHRHRLFYSLRTSSDCLNQVIDVTYMEEYE